MSLVEPFALRTERFLLDQPTSADVDDIARYCADPVFEHYMTTPWPYERADAEFFVDDYVRNGWADGAEWTWAIRDGEGEPLLGVVGIRLLSGMLGYWLGAPHRGRGVMPEAATAVIDAVFERTDREEIGWECVVGNTASLRVAQKAGFTFTGERPGRIPSRDGSPITSWHGVLGRGDSRAPKHGWPGIAENHVPR